MIKASFELILHLGGLYRSGGGHILPLVMFKCHLRCPLGLSSEQTILSRSAGEQIISGNTDIPWPARSPDQAPCDFWLWSICEAEVRRVKPKTLDDLMEVVSDFVASLDPAEVRRAVRDVRPRAELCVKMDGGHFESELKKYKRGTIEE